MIGVDTAQTTVVVGVDGSDSARHAAQWAAELASAWRAPLHLVHTVPSGVAAQAGDLPWLRELCDAAERVGVESVDGRVVVGSPPEQLVACSRDAGVAVVGSYGEGGSSGMLVGSVAGALVENAECPVAIVRGAAPGLPPPRRGPVLV